MSAVRRILFTCLVVLIPVAQACAHAFLKRSDPAVGGKVHSAPAEVRIWFTEAIEPAFSSIQVFDTAGKQLDKKDSHVDSTNHSLLHVSLSPLVGPGSYKVVWRVVSVDTHVTKGNFTFQVVP